MLLPVIVVSIAVFQTSREVSSESEEEAGSEAQGKRTKVWLLMDVSGSGQQNVW